MKQRLGLMITIFLCCSFLVGCFNETAPKPTKDQKFLNVFATSFFYRYEMELESCLELYASDWLTDEESEEFSQDFMFKEPEIEKIDHDVVIYRSVTPNGTSAELRTVDEKIFWIKFSGDGSAQQIVDLQTETPRKKIFPIGVPPLEAEGADAQYCVRAVATAIGEEEPYKVVSETKCEQFNGSGTIKTERAEYRFKNDKNRWVLIVSPA